MSHLPEVSTWIRESCYSQHYNIPAVRWETPWVLLIVVLSDRLKTTVGKTPPPKTNQFSAFYAFKGTYSQIRPIRREVINFNLGTSYILWCMVAILGSALSVSFLGFQFLALEVVSKFRHLSTQWKSQWHLTECYIQRYLSESIFWPQVLVFYFYQFIMYCLTIDWTSLIASERVLGTFLSNNTVSKRFYINTIKHLHAIC